MDGFREILCSNQPLLLFVVIGLGYIFGQIKFHGFSFGIAGVLFVGLAFGAWHPPGTQLFSIPRQISELGLILFVYAIGLTSGPGFFESLQQRGVRYNIAAFGALMLGAMTALLIGVYAFALSPALISGVFCGSLTNTPALAAVTQIVQSAEDSTAPAVGYSVAYPFAILSFLLAFQLFTAFRRKELDTEKATLLKDMERETNVVVKHFEIRNPEIFGHPIGELQVQNKTGVIISRIRHNKDISVANKYTLLQEGDVIVCVGPEAKMARAKDYFGAESAEHIDIDSGKIELFRILVSNKKLVGLTIKDLELGRRFNAQITRLRRADIEIVPSYNKVIELGDRLRVVAPTDKIPELRKLFGDSERAMAELDFTAMTIGISLGVLIGMIPFPLPGGSSVALGVAGGPIIVALILGKLGRTGPLVWSLPLEANHTIRHIGLLLFLACVGINSGSHFWSTICTNGLQLLTLSILISIITTLSMIVLLRWFAKAGVISTLGAASGVHTQPASLARAYELSQSDEVYVGYAITYPIAMISKIILAQLILIIGRAL